jgi:hypothetical protein
MGARDELAAGDGAALGFADDLDEALDDLQPEPAVAGSTVLDALRAHRASMVGGKTTDVDVPGWEGLLVLRFGATSPDQQAALAERIVKSRGKGRALAAANVDLLIAAFRCGLGRARVGDELEVLPDADGDPAGLKDLVAIVGLGEATTARDAMRRLFSLANDPEAALNQAGGEWHDWAVNENEEADEQFVGER